MSWTVQPPSGASYQPAILASPAYDPAASTSVAYSGALTDEQGRPLQDDALGYLEP